MDSFLHKMGYEYKVKALNNGKNTKQSIYTVSLKYFKYLKRQIREQKSYSTKVTQKSTKQQLTFYTISQLSF